MIGLFLLGMLIASPAAAVLATSTADTPLPATDATTLRAADLRVASVGFRLAVAGRGFCPQTYPATGLLLHHLAEYDQAGRRIEIQRHQLDRGPGVLATVASSPSAQAGLRAGDILLSVNGTDFTPPALIAREADPDRRRRLIEGEQGRLEAALRLGPAKLRLLREGAERNLVLDSVPGCPARVRLAYSSQPTAFSNRGYVILTTRVLNLIASDDELAVVIGHELGHHVLDHEQRLAEQKVPKGVLRGIGKNASRVRALEEEADRFGLRIAARAGYDIAATAGLWARVARAGWSGPQLFRTHPTVAARKRMIDDILAEQAGAR